MWLTGEDDLKPLTHWICVDLTQKSGIHLLQQGLRYLVRFFEIIHLVRNFVTLLYEE